MVVELMSLCRPRVFGNAELVDFMLNTNLSIKDLSSLAIPPILQMRKDPLEISESSKSGSGDKSGHY